MILNQHNEAWNLPPGPPAQPYPTIIPSYFASPAGTTLNLQANKAKVYFQYFSNYSQSTSHIDTFEIVIILLGTVDPPQQQLFSTINSIN